MNSDIHVLLLCAVPDGAGAMRMMASFAKGLVAVGHRVTLIYGTTSSTTGVSWNAGEEIIDGLSRHGVRIVPQDGFRRRYDFGLAGRLRRFVMEENVKVIVGFHPLDIKHALQVGGKCRRSCVISTQNKHVFWGGWFARAFKKAVYGHMLRRNATRVICPSRVLYEEVRNFGVKEERCCILPNGIPVQEYTPDPDVDVSGLRSDFGVGRGDLLLVNTGRLDLQKGQDILLNSLKNVRSNAWHLLLVGDVSEGRRIGEAQAFRSKLNELAGRHGRIHFLGWRDDVALILQGADIYVHTARWEGLSLAVVEAMAAEKAIITSDCSGRPEGFIDGTHGYVTRTGDIGALTDALDKMLAIDRDSLQEMGKRCHLLAKSTYDVSEISKRFVQELEKTIHAR